MWLEVVGSLSPPPFPPPSKSVGFGPSGASASSKRSSEKQQQQQSWQNLPNELCWAISFLARSRKPDNMLQFWVHQSFFLFFFFSFFLLIFFLLSLDIDLLTCFYFFFILFDFSNVAIQLVFQVFSSSLSLFLIISKLFLISINQHQKCLYILFFSFYTVYIRKLFEYQINFNWELIHVAESVIQTCIQYSKHEMLIWRGQKEKWQSQIKIINILCEFASFWLSMINFFRVFLFFNAFSIFLKIIWEIIHSLHNLAKD